MSPRRVPPQHTATCRPLVMSANTTQFNISGSYGGLNAGQTITLDAGRLRNVYRQPILVTEMRFTLWPNTLFLPTWVSSGAHATVDLPDYGGYFFVRIAVGGKQLTWGNGVGTGTGSTGPGNAGFVPLWMLARNYSLGSEATQDCSCYYRWQFPKPLLVMPNTSFEVEVNYRNGMTTDAGNAYGNVPTIFDIEVAAVGRTLAAGEVIDANHVDIPFASAFSANATSGLISGELSLRNPFQVPLRVQRLMGRTLLTPQVLVAAVQPTNPLSGAWQGQPQDGNAVSEIGTIVTLDLQDSEGQRLLTAPVPLGYMFWPGEEWIFDRDMLPNDIYSAQFTNPANANGTNFALSSAFQPMVGIVGSRQEAV